jgi:hypothetical protein
MWADLWIDEIVRLIEIEVGRISPLARTNLSIALDDFAWAFFVHGQNWDGWDDDGDDPAEPEPDPPVPPDDDGEKPDLYALFKIPVLA